MNSAHRFACLIVVGYFCSLTPVAAGPYAPAAGQAGSTAIAHSDSRFVSWASGITVDYSAALAIPDEEFQDETNALGPAMSPEEAIFDVVSLGRGGEAVLTFDTPIVDGAGADFAVFENSFSDTFLELATVWVSDGSLAPDGSGATLFLPFDIDVWPSRVQTTLRPES
ncbi:MAG: hypothetical protein AAF387_16525 [Pseudomonadota bacterium]